MRASSSCAPPCATSSSLTTSTTHVSSADSHTYHFLSHSSAMYPSHRQEARREERSIDTEKAEKIGDKERNNEKKPEEGKKEEEKAPPLMALNHVSRVCRNVKESIEFYTKVLGFVLTERPQVFDFDGAWLFNYGVGIHLMQSKDDEKLPPNTKHLDPQDNHISFQCENMEAMEQRLKKMNVKYMKRTMEAEGGTAMDQIFFNDPDGFMVEICNCENLKLVPAGSLGKIKLPLDRHNPPLDPNHNNHGDAK